MNTSRPFVPAGDRVRTACLTLMVLAALSGAWPPAPACAQDAAASRTAVAAVAAPDSPSGAPGSAWAGYGPPRWFLAAGPYRPPKDEPHWVDPRGSVVLDIGAGLPVCPVAVLGVEALGWLGSYAAEAPSGPFTANGQRMHGTFVGAGPMAMVSTRAGRWEPFGTASVLAVYGHLSHPAAFTGLGGAEGRESRWKGTMAFGAGVAFHAWETGGLEVRYQHVPLEMDFAGYSSGSAKVGMDAAMLSVYGTLPRGKSAAH